MLGATEFKALEQNFPGGSVVKKKNQPANAGDMGSIPGPGRSHMPQSNWSPCTTYWACALESGNHNYWDPAP